MLKNYRPLLKISLRKALLAFTLVAVLLGYGVIVAQKQKAVVEHIRRSGDVYYEFSWDDKAIDPVLGGSPDAPNWLVGLVGIDFLYNVKAVEWHLASDDRVSSLRDLSSLQFAGVYGESVVYSDLLELSRLAGLRHLVCVDTSLTAEEKERLSQHLHATISGFESVTFVP